MIKLKGVLVDASNKPVSGAKIILRSVKNGSVPTGVEAEVVTDEKGAYDFSANVGSYLCYIFVENKETALPGYVNIYDYSGAGTLQEYLYAPCEVDARPMFIFMWEIIRQEISEANENINKKYDEIKSMSDDIENKYNAKTFYKTKTDPDGTIAGLAGTDEGDYFRVAQGTESNKSFVYYFKVNGIAVPVSSSPSATYVENVVSELNDFTKAFGHSVSTLSESAYEISLAENISKTTSVSSNENMAAIINRIDGSKQYQLKLWSKVKVQSNGKDVASFLVLESDLYQNGKRESLFAETTIDKMTYSATVEDDKSFRVQYETNISDKVFSDQSAFYAWDISENAVAINSSSASSATKLSVCLHHETGLLQLVVPKSLLISSGVLEPKPDDAFSYAYSKVSESVFNIRTTTVRTYPFGPVLIGEPGVMTVDISNNGQTLQSEYAINSTVNMAIRTPRVNRVTDNTGHKRLSCDVSNNLTIPLTNVPVEIKVNFEPGEARSDRFITVTDFDGNSYDCQFVEEWDVNSRKQASYGYWSDGSLRSGSLFIFDSFAARETKYYIVRVHQHAQRPAVTPNWTRTDKGFDLELNGYTYSFNKEYGFGMSAITENGVTTPYVYKPLIRGLGAIDGDAVPNESNIRVVSSGPVFVELESTVTNRGRDGVDANAIKYRMRTVVFKNGNVKFDSFNTATKDIPANMLFGVTARLLVTTSNAVVDANNSTAIWDSSVAGKKRSGATVYANGDVHRDGPQAGPTRPVNAAAIKINNNSTRFDAGWIYANGATESAAIDKGWTWTHGMWINMDEKLTATADIAAAIQNRPVGFAGDGAHPYVQQQKLISEIEDFCLGYARFWNKDATTTDTGSPYRNGYGADLLNSIRFGVGTFQQVYQKFYDYCNGRWKNGFANLGPAYGGNSLPLQFASRIIAQPLWWLYKVANEKGYTAEETELKKGILSFATELKNRFNANGGMPLQPMHGGIGNSNSNSTGFRFIAMAVASGQDADGSFSKALDDLDKMMLEKFMPLQNIISDGTNERVAQTRYMAYQAYAYNNYVLGCRAAGRTPKYNLDTYMLLATASYGAVKDIEYCISESRRGSANTTTLSMMPLFANNTISGIVAARNAFNAIYGAMGPIPGRPKRLYDFTEEIVSDKALEFGFNLNCLSDIWFDYYYSLRA